MQGHFEEIHGPRNPVARWIGMTQSLIRFIYDFATMEGSPTHELLIRHFVNCLLRDKEPMISAEDGLRSVEIIKAIYKSIKQEVPVTVDRL